MSATRSGEAPPQDPSADQPDRPAPARSATPTLSIEVVAVAVVVGVGVVARFVTSSPLWLDEALSVNIASLPLADIPEALRHDGHPPLYYFVLHFWIRLFGSGDVGVRTLSALFGLAALMLLWLAAKRAAGSRAAWCAVVIGAIAPFAVRYGTEARMYSLVMALVAAGYLAVRWAIDRPTPGRLAVVAIIGGALLLTHYWAIWLLAATIGVLVWQKKAKAAAALAAGGVLLLPWLPSLLEQAANTGTPWADPVRPTAIVHTGLQDFGSAATGVALAEGTLFGLTTAVLFLVGLFGRTVDDRRLEVDVRTVPDVRSEAAVVGATVALAAVGGYVTGTTFASRYLAVVFPLFAIVAGAGLAKLPGRPARLVIGAALVGLALVGIGVNALLPRTQAEEVVDAITGAAAPNDVVVFCPDQLGPAFGRNLPDDLTMLVYPSLAGPERVDWVDYVERYDGASAPDVAAEIDGRAGPDHDIWLVTAGGYNVSDHCGELVAALAALRGGPAVVVTEDPDIFEPASLLRFGAGAGE